MALVAVRINSVSGIPLDKDGEINEEGWEIEDKDEEIVFVDIDDVWDIVNAVADVRDMLENWQADA